MRTSVGKWKILIDSVCLVVTLGMVLKIEMNIKKWTKLYIIMIKI